ncbi:MAG: WD40 repeat domain-containing protein, partial [Fimbriimonadales bacterium]|nr:WD40 repeat domain-containing protein [Fimbriimonadales bacterium]
MRRLLLASLALALGLYAATAQPNGVLSLEGTPFETPSVDLSSNGVWLGATGVVGISQLRGAKLWNLLTGDTYFLPSDNAEAWYSVLRFVPATNDLAVLTPFEHLTVYRPFQLYRTEWRPLARFFVPAERFDVAPNFAAAAFVDNVARVLLLRGLTLQPLDWDGVASWSTHIAFSPDGAILAIAGRRLNINGYAVRLVRMSDLSIVREFPVAFEIVGLAYAPNGRYLAVAGWEGQLRLWDLQTSQFWDSAAVSRPISSIRFSSDSALLAVGENDGFVRLRRTPDLSPHSA